MLGESILFSNVHLVPQILPQTYFTQSIFVALMDCKKIQFYSLSCIIIQIMNFFDGMA